MADLESKVDSGPEGEAEATSGRTPLLVYLMKEGVGGREDYLSSPDDWEPFVAEVPGADAAFVLIDSNTKPVSWWGYIKPLLGILDSDRVKELSEQVSIGCLLEIKLRGRVFVLSFGPAHLKIKRDAQVPNFGLVVTLNLISPEHVKQLRRKKLKRNTRTILESLRKPTRAEDYGLELSEDLFRGIDGIPVDPELGSRIGGTSGFHFLSEKTVASLSAVLGRLLTSYSDGVDPEKFPWFGKLKLLTEEEIYTLGLRARLVDRLNQYLAGQDTDEDDIQLLFHDETLQEYSMEAVRLTGKVLDGNSIELPRFELSCLRGRFDRPLTSTEIFGLKIHIHTAASERIRQLNFEDCLYYTHEQNDSRYLLIDGDWLCVEARLFVRVDQDLQRIVRARVIVNPPEAEPKEHHYINEATRSGGYWTSGHTETLPYGGGRSSFEAADLIGSQGELMALKCYKNSTQSLAHAFVQVRQSARVLSEETEVRENFLSALPVSHQEKFRRLDEERARWTYKLGIITDRELTSLPFSIRQEIVELGRDVQACGFNFEVVSVGR